MLIKLMLTALVVIVALRFIGLGLFAAREGYHPAWSLAEFASSITVLSLLLAIWY